MPRNKRPRTAASTSTANPHNEALVAFPPDVVKGDGAQLRLTDIVMNDDATVTCDYCFRGVASLGTFRCLGSAFGELGGKEEDKTKTKQTG